MEYKTPKAFHVSTMQLLHTGMVGALTELGAPDWRHSDGDNDDTLASEGEQIAEFAGRLCYLSFGTELNKNLTRVREGTGPYVRNVVSQKHGSVFEHVVDGFALINVSRVFTHELVRHRHAGYSQTSGRYVRVDKLDMTAFPRDLFAQHEIEALENAAEVAERAVRGVASRLDRMKDFAVKKRLTSAIRRFLPNGQTTNIMVTANARAWRDMIIQRTSPHAELEIRELFWSIAQQLADNHPNLYADARHSRPDDGPPVVTFDHGRI